MKNSSKIILSAAAAFLVTCEAHRAARELDLNSAESIRDHEEEALATDTAEIESENFLQGPK